MFISWQRSQLHGHGQNCDWTWLKVTVRLACVKTKKYSNNIIICWHDMLRASVVFRNFNTFYPQSRKTLERLVFHD